MKNVSLFFPQKINLALKKNFNCSCIKCGPNSQLENANAGHKTKFLLKNTKRR